MCKHQRWLLGLLSHCNSPHMSLACSPWPIVVAAGALDGAEAAFALHVMPHVPTGVLGTRAGTIMAGALSFHVTVKGE